MSEKAASFRKVLLVEDEPALAEAMKIALKKTPIGDLAHALTLKKARELFNPRETDLVILDRNLPDGDGIGFCEEIREQGFLGAILFLTARGNIEDRVGGLNAGADDYLPKPFSWEELNARISALFRRMRPQLERARSENSARKTWEIDAERLRILGPKGWVTLTPLEFKLAIHLVNAKGAIVSREELLKEVWGFRFLPKTRTVDYFMGRLRKRFETDPDQPKHFLTVRGAGYRFTSEPSSHPSD